MPATDTQHPDSMGEGASQRAIFFRQSGWVIFAGVASGALMWGVHFLAKKIPDAEYGTVVKMLAVLTILPLLPVQMVVTREAAGALAIGQTGRVTGLIRGMLAAILVVWLVIAAFTVWFQADILAEWKVAHPASLWLLLVSMLAVLVMPVFYGALQGAQKFLWLGGATIVNGGVRLATAAGAVFLVTATASGVMAGVLAGSVAAVAVALWQSRGLWTGPAQRIPWAAVSRQIAPLVIGFTASQFLFSADTIFVGAFFSAQDTGFYAAAGTLARAIMWLVMPLAAVMFPKQVQRAAKAAGASFLGITLVATAGLAICGAVGLVVLGPWVVRLVYTAQYVEVATAILPWYAGAMIPLSVANVLVNDLLARSDYRVVPWLGILAVGYALTLGLWHPSLVAVLQVFAGFTTLLLLATAAHMHRSPSAGG